MTCRQYFRLEIHKSSVSEIVRHYRYDLDAIVRCLRMQETILVDLWLEWSILFLTKETDSVRHS